MNKAYIKLKNKENSLSSWFRGSYLWVILLLVYIPIFIVILWSFNSPGRHGLYNPNFGTMTISEYENLFTAAGFWHSFFQTVIISASAGAISVCIATVAAYGMWRGSKVVRNLSSSQGNVSIVMPDIITAISISFLLISIIIPIGLKPGYTTAIFSNVSYGMAYSLFLIYPRMQKLNRFVIDASFDLGNNAFKTFFKVTVPFVLPAIISAFALTFAWSFDDFIITRIALGNNLNVTTTSIQLYISAYKGIKAYYFAFGSLLIVSILSVAIVYSVFKSIRHKRTVKK